MELEAYLKTHLKLYTFLAVLTGLMMVGLPLTLAVTQRAGRAPELRPDPPAAIRAQPAGVSSGLLLTVAGPPPEANALALVIPAVVRVTGAAFAGSGVIIDPSGTVLTSAHIVGNATEVGVVVEDTWRLTGRVVRTDAKRDLALVQLPPGAYRAASLARGAAPSLGAAAVVIGYPLGLPGPASVAIGVVSRLVHEPELGRTVLQTDAAVNLGNSGGPIVDYRGGDHRRRGLSDGGVPVGACPGHQLRRVGGDHPAGVPDGLITAGRPDSIGTPPARPPTPPC